MRIFLLSMLLCIVSGLQAQEILSQEHYSDGTLRSTRYVENCRVHFINYHENGLVKEIGCFHRGKRDGAWKQYSNNGTLLASALFERGMSQGVWEFRTEGNKPLGRITYGNGTIATAEQFNDLGELLAQRDHR